MARKKNKQLQEQSIYDKYDLVKKLFKEADEVLDVSLPL